GHYVWWFVSWDELETAWNKRSDIGFHEEDAKGQNLYGTLIRYMTSKGLNKDAEGLAELSLEDISAIESGVASITSGKRSGLRSRLDRVFLEIDIYRDGGDPTGHSLTQRLEFWRAGWHAFTQNWLIGVGTGDVHTAMGQAYEEINSKLSSEARLRAHNQYLTFALTFGIVGIVWIIGVLVYPLRKGYLPDFHFFMFYSMALMSMITEDTLESQAGLSYFVFLLTVVAIARDPRD
ncbi:MAG: O-antigen ligase family protein, partial [Flavobacteriales bacterium]|nr:O-antigen ligase family protein [Flavobacteriales bacterium]